MNGDTNETICTIIKEVDQRQKEAIVQSSSCITCDSTLVTAINNTIPLSFFMCDGSDYKAFLTPGGDTTNLFRVEEIMENCTIKCRLITQKPGLTEEKRCQDLICTDQTCIIDLNCVCCLQCFTPIFCRKCSRR